MQIFVFSWPFRFLFVLKFNCRDCGRSTFGGKTNQIDFRRKIEKKSEKFFIDFFLDFRRFLQRPEFFCFYSDGIFGIFGIWTKFYQIFGIWTKFYEMRQSALLRGKKRFGIWNLAEPLRFFSHFGGFLDPGRGRFSLLFCGRFDNSSCDSRDDEKKSVQNRQRSQAPGLCSFGTFGGLLFFVLGSL